MGLTKELKDFLSSQGAALVGIGDLRGVDACGFHSGVAIAIPLPRNVIVDLQNAPTREYYDLYYAMNRKLNEIVLAGEGFLKERGFEAYAQSTDRVKVDQVNTSKLPHKTVATRAGLGWVGKKQSAGDASIRASGASFLSAVQHALGARSANSPIPLREVRAVYSPMPRPGLEGNAVGGRYPTGTYGGH